LDDAAVEKEKAAKEAKAAAAAKKMRVCF